MFLNMCYLCSFAVPTKHIDCILIFLAVLGWFCHEKQHIIKVDKEKDDVEIKIGAKIIYMFFCQVELQSNFTVKRINHAFLKHNSNPGKMFVCVHT